MDLTLAEWAIVIGIGAYIVRITLGIMKPSGNQDTAIALLQKELDNYKLHNSELIALQQNHTHTLETKIDGLDVRMREMTTALSVLHNTIQIKLDKK
jgi:hypothetical protein